MRKGKMRGEMCIVFLCKKQTSIKIQTPQRNLWGFEYMNVNEVIDVCIVYGVRYEI